MIYIYAYVDLQQQNGFSPDESYIAHAVASYTSNTALPSIDGHLFPAVW